MNILLAGGAGFIGSHLADALLEEGHAITCADNLVFGNSANIAHLAGHPRFQFVKTDLSNLDEALAVFDCSDFDAVYHLAANSDIQKGGQEPSIDFRDTFMTTRCILEGMRRNGVKRLFFSSTSAVYGEKTDEVLREDTGDLRPVSYYGGAKLASEALISSYTSMLDMRAVVFRFPNVIGPRLTHGVIFDFVAKLRRDSSVLEILGDGSQCKPYISVFDLVSAIVKLTSSWQEGMEIFNIGVESDGTTVTHIAEIVVQEMGLEDVEFSYTGGDRGWKGDVPRFQYDISKALATGWKPDMTSDEAVRAAAKAAVEA